VHAYRLDEGKVVEVHEYRSWQDALKAAGLER